MQVNRVPLNLASLVCLNMWHDSSRYERYQRALEITGKTFSLKFQGINLASGGGKLKLKAGRYELLAQQFDPGGVAVGEPVVIAAATVEPGKVTSAYFKGSTDSIPFDRRWAGLTIRGLGAGETNPIYFGFVNKSGAPVVDPPAVPVFDGSYDVTRWSTPTGGQRWGFAPPRANQTPSPLPARAPAYSGEAVSHKALLRINLVPNRGGNIRRLSRRKSGLVVSTNKQNYTWGGLTRRLPENHLLDGPRGVGTLSMVTHLRVSRHAGAVFCTSWSWGKIHADGRIQTYGGYRHRAPFPSQYEEKSPDLELVGRGWEELREDGRPVGIQESWGGDYDPRTLLIDESAPLVGPPANPTGFEHPHVRGPRWFMTDSQHGLPGKQGRVLMFAFNKDNHDDPVVTEFITGLHDPFDCVCDENGVLYVSERGAHRIGAYSTDGDKGKLLGYVLDCGEEARRLGFPEDIHRVDPNRFFGSHVRKYAQGGLTAIRDLPTVYPEGLVLQDGILGIGSSVQGEVRNLTLATGDLRTLCRPPITTGSHFIKMSRSDGTIFPRGTTGVSTWAITNGGYPSVYLPDGKEIKLHEYYAHKTVGRGGRWDDVAYGSCSAIGNGAILFATSQEGVIKLVLAQPTDEPVDEAKYRAGASQLDAFVHGPAGFPYYDIPAPWGRSEALDYYLRQHDHTAPADAPKPPPPGHSEPPVEPGEPDNPEPGEPQEPGDEEPPTEDEDGDGGDLPDDPEDPPAPEPEPEPPADVTKLRAALAEAVAMRDALSERLAAADSERDAAAAGLDEMLVRFGELQAGVRRYQQALDWLLKQQ